jgi:hypothetical protein
MVNQLIQTEPNMKRHKNTPKTAQNSTQLNSTKVNSIQFNSVQFKEQ